MREPTPRHPAVERHGQVVLFMIFLCMLGGRYDLGRLSPGLEGIDAQAVGVIAVFFTWAMWWPVARQWTSASGGLSTPLVWFTMLWIYLGCSTLWAPEAARTVGPLVNVVTLMVLTWLAASVASRLSAPTLRSVWTWLLVAGAIYLLAALSAGAGLGGRFSAFGGGPNVFVRVMVLAAIAALYFGTARRSRLVFLILLPAFMVGAVLSGSRGGLVAAAVVGVVGTWPVAKRMSTRAKLLVLVTGGAAALAAPKLIGAELNLLVVDRYSQLTSGQLRNSDRSHIATLAIDLWHRSPIVGNGLDSFYALGGSAQYVGHPHNLLLAVTAEGGLVATALLAAALGSFFWAATRQRPVATDALFALLAAGCILVASMFSGDYYDSRFMWFFLVLAVAHVMKARNGATAPEESPQENRTNRARLSIG